MILFTVLVLAAAVSSLALSLTTSKTACRHTLLKAGSLRMISTSGGDFDSADGRPSKEEEVVRRVLYSPNTVPSSDELKIVLNSLKHLYDSGTKSDTFMERCRKQKVLNGFRAMEEDHPLQNLNLADVEKLFTEHPKIMEALTNVSVSAFNFPSVPSIGIEGLQVVAPEVKTYFTWAAAVAASVIAMKEMGIMDVETFLASCLGAFSTAYILDRPPFLNGLISRSAGWLRAIIDFSIPQKKEVVHRQTAAAFLVAYFTGTPILSINMDPRDSQVRRRSIYADALKIETVDPTMGVLEGKGKISLRALQRTIAMQTASIAVDIMDGRDTDVTPYLRILMAALFERANTLQYSTLQVSDFSTFILPTLLRWGILEALLILKESSECYKAVLDVVQRGGDVGDAVLALEAALTSDHPLYKRQEMRLQEQAAASAIAPAAQSLTPFVELIIKARQVPDSTFVEDDAPHELIKGTDRIYTREELILHPNPSVEDVKQLTQDLMKMRIELDRGVDGRIPQATREYIHRLAADVNAALRVVYEGKNSVQPLSALQEALDANSAVLRTEAGLLDSQIPPLLKELGVPPQAYEEQLVELHVLDKVWSEYMRDFQTWWALSGKAAVFKFTGRDVDEAVGSAWRAVKSNQVTNSPVANSFSMNGAVGAMLELQIILTRLQVDTSDVAFKSLVPSLEEGEASLPAELSPTLVALLQGATRASSAPKDLLRRHSGRAFTRLDSKLSALGSRVDDIEASLDGKSSALE